MNPTHPDAPARTRNTLRALPAISLFGLLTAMPLTTHGQNADQGIEIEQDVPYGSARGRPLLCDVLRPEQPASERLPCIVYIHGGGWRQGDKASGTARLAPLVATGNYVGVSVGYRLSGEAKWPAQIEDCQAALRWIREHAAELGIDPERIGVWGFSAGGHLSAFLAVTEGMKEIDALETRGKERVRCAVAMSPPVYFFNEDRNPELREGMLYELLGTTFGEKPEVYKQASPAAYVHPDTPPILFVSGDADQVVPFEPIRRFSDDLEAQGVEAPLIRLVGAGHRYRSAELESRIAAFFDRHLRDRPEPVSVEPIEIE